MKTEAKAIAMMNEKTLKRFQEYTEMWEKDIMKAYDGTTEDADQTVILVTALALYFKKFVEVAKQTLD